eukprot:TRINITY_DN16937_c0_g1_i1.p1 TRINITY_DN16937_c0_g1~~TRINITY_DN16937_c0_g1_i1.p1  ORF type:complete len:540 (+),score=156.64 TRINITY_DN16937_c0_g1_i1:55-1674(+)
MASRRTVLGCDAVYASAFLLICMFCLAYKSGSTSGLADYERRFATQRNTADVLERRLSKCIAENAQHEVVLHDDLGYETQQLHDLNNVLSAELQQHSERLTDARAEFDECEGNLFQDRHDRVEQERQDFQTIARLEFENRELRARAERLETGGAETKILTKAIGKLAVEHTRLRKALGMPPLTVSPAYLDKLMFEWSGAEHEEFRENLGKVREPNATELGVDVKPVEKFSNLEADNLKLFRMEKVESGFTHPEWTGVTGNRPSSKGVYRNAPIPRSTIALQLKRLKEYALCAQGLNVTDLMFPALFHPDETPDATMDIRDLFVTPYVSFCEECKFFDKASSFHLLCQGYSGREQYGGKLFWEVRSRIVPSDAVRTAAADFIAEHSLLDNAIAVRLPRGTPFADGTLCKPGLLHFYNVVLKDAGVRELSTVPENHCMPEGGYVVEQLTQLMEEYKADKVFLLSEWDAADLRAHGLPKSKAVVQLPPELHTNRKSFATLVELHVAAQMKQVVVNRYDPQSALLSEAFLLSHNLSTEGLLVW